MTAPVQQVLSRGGRRALGYGLATVLGFARRGFFIPCRHAAVADTPAVRVPYLPFEAMLAAREAAFVRFLKHLEADAEALAAIGDTGDARWDQDWFPRLDAAAAYAMVRHLRPRLVVEIGSGHSTRFFSRALADAGNGGGIRAIDPAPRADICRLARVEIVLSPVQNVWRSAFADVTRGDIVSIDSSHILMPGSDVDVMLNRVLPALPSGTYVHFHDIFLPEDYPPEWRWRGYNEQQGVAPLVTGGGWEVLFSSRYAVRRLSDVLAGSFVATLPLPTGAYESSLWLKKA